MSEPAEKDDKAWREWLDALRFSERWDLIESAEAKRGWIYEAFVAGRKSASVSS